MHSTIPMLASSPMLGVFALVAILVILLIIGVGIVIAAVIAAAIALLVSAGIVSSSMVVGFKTRSVSAGVRLAIFQIFVALGIVAGLGIAAAVKVFCHLALSFTIVEVIGLTAGLCMGMVVGASFSTLLKYVLNQWEPRKDKGFEVVPPPAITSQI